MYKTITSLCFILSLSIPHLTAQISNFKWGKLSNEERELKTCEFQSEADAVVLFEDKTMQIQALGQKWACAIKVHKRIKILKETGIDRGDIELYYYSGESGNKISSIKAHTISPNGDSQKLNKDNIFKKVISEYTTKVSFSFPKVEVGSILELKYTIYRTQITALPTVYFQGKDPTYYTKLTLRFPSFFDYIYINNTNGLVSPTEKGELWNDPKLGEIVVSTYDGKNIKGISKERYITTMDDYYAKIEFQLSAIENSFGHKEPFIGTWDELANTLRENENFGKQYLKPKKIKALQNDFENQYGILNNKKEIIEKAYQYINQTIKWNGKFALFAQESLNKVFELKEGWSSDLNLSFIALLRAYDINANPVVISTRDHGAMLPQYPIINQFNHLYVQVELDSLITNYDLSSNYRQAGLLHENSLNYKGWLVTETSNEWIRTIAEPSFETFLGDFTLNEDGSMNGQMTGQFKTYFAEIARQGFDKDKSESVWNSHLESYGDYTISDIKSENLEDLDKPFKEVFTLEIDAAATIANDFIYFNPILRSDYFDNPFTIEERNFPVQISYPMVEQNVMTFTIPEGYHIEELPQTSKVSMINDTATFRYLASYNELTQKVQIVSKIAINNTFYSTDEYFMLKDFFSLIKEKLGEQIVLKIKE